MFHYSCKILTRDGSEKTIEDLLNEKDTIELVVPGNESSIDTTLIRSEEKHSIYEITVSDSVIYTSKEQIAFIGNKKAKRVGDINLGVDNLTSYLDCHHEYKYYSQVVLGEDCEQDILPTKVLHTPDFLKGYFSYHADLYTESSFIKLTAFSENFIYNIKNVLTAFNVYSTIVFKKVNGKYILTIDDWSSSYNFYRNIGVIYDEQIEILQDKLEEMSIVTKVEETAYKDYMYYFDTKEYVICDGFIMHGGVY